MSLKAVEHRSVGFRDRAHGRYWWFQATQSNYVPPIFSILTDDEWDLIGTWYEETERGFSAGTGECNVSAMSMLLGLVMGNNISRIVQCGHFIGFSTLIFGLMARHMGHKHALYSIDIDEHVTAVTQSYIDRGGLSDYVKLRIGDSAEVETGLEALNYLGGKPQLLFVDSSHEYNHTIRELDHWYHFIQPGGFVIMHDVSEFAAKFDALGNGGVRGAVRDWVQRNNLQALMINDFATADHYGDRTVYKDACGLGIIQKPS